MDTTRLGMGLAELLGAFCAASFAVAAIPVGVASALSLRRLHPTDSEGEL